MKVLWNANICGTRQLPCYSLDVVSYDTLWMDKIRGKYLDEFSMSYEDKAKTELSRNAGTRAFDNCRLLLCEHISKQ